MAKKELATQDAQLPAYLRDNGPARGSENAGVDDIILPRLLLLQSLSPQLDEQAPEYIDGAKAGDIINSLTGENYGREVTIVPVYFRREYIIWKKREKGGGFCGSYPTKTEAQAALLNLEPPETDYDIEDTATQFVLVLKEDGSADQAVISFSRTKLSASRKLQSLIRLTGVDSFASQYRLTSVQAQSDLGKYYNYNVASLGFVPEEIYHAGEACYQSITENEERYKAHGAEEASAEEPAF